VAVVKQKGKDLMNKKQVILKKGVAVKTLLRAINK